MREGERIMREGEREKERESEEKRGEMSEVNEGGEEVIILPAYQLQFCLFNCLNRGCLTTSKVNHSMFMRGLMTSRTSSSIPTMLVG